MRKPKKKAVMPPKPPLGTGARFKRLEAELAAKGNVKDPAGLAASIARKKYGQKKLTQLAQAGRKRAKAKRGG